MVTDESFSDSYVLVNGVDLIEYPGDEFLMDAVLQERLEDKYGDPELLVRLGKVHYEPEASLTIPTSTVVVPDYIEADTDKESIMVLNGDGGVFSNLW